MNVYGGIMTLEGRMRSWITERNQEFEPWLQPFFIDQGAWHVKYIGAETPPTYVLVTFTRINGNTHTDSVKLSYLKELWDKRRVDR